MDEIKVSVICAAYNHEKYIEDAIRGFLKQKTNFKFEVFIHDDASTDNTAAIIKKYADQYPELIRPIFQKENQYSQHISFFKNDILPLARGKYLAVCEGDDYWVDENKLQKQADYLDAHPDCSFCCGACLEVNLDGTTRRELHPFDRAGEYTMNDFPYIKTNIPTATMMYRIEYVDLQGMKFSSHTRGFHIGAKPRQMFLLTKGSMYYDDSILSAYRIGNSQSWMGQMLKANVETRVRSLDASVKMMKCFDEETEGKYHDAVEFMIREQEFAKARLLLDYPTIRDKKNKYFYDKMSRKDKLKLWMQRKTPRLYALVMKRRSA
ncbi:MAG: glycosyltransferase family 2 protein [Clostridia bacterium]|nr:glycosyltransferase family 2 protein [Clostridia bacterium]